MTKAMDLFAWDEEKRSFYTSFKQMKLLLAAFHLQAGHRIMSPHWSNVPELAIAAINFRVKGEVEYWHWVVIQRHDGEVVVLDPRSSREQRTDLGRMRLHAYIAIKPKA